MQRCTGQPMLLVPHACHYPEQTEAAPKGNRHAAHCIDASRCLAMGMLLAPKRASQPLCHRGGLTHVPSRRQALHAGRAARRRDGTASAAETDAAAVAATLREP